MPQRHFGHISTSLDSQAEFLLSSELLKGRLSYVASLKPVAREFTKVSLIFHVLYGLPCLNFGGRMHQFCFIIIIVQLQ